MVTRSQLLSSPVFAPRWSPLWGILAGMNGSLRSPSTPPALSHPLTQSPLEQSQQTFLKGLCIVDDVAFFGIAPASPRSSRADESLECELGAYDLLNKELLFRKKMPTKGLLNVVAAPDLAEDSTQRALRTPDGAFRRCVSLPLPLSFLDDDGVCCDDGGRDEPHSSDESNDESQDETVPVPFHHSPPLTTTHHHQERAAEGNEYWLFQHNMVFHRMASVGQRAKE